MKKFVLKIVFFLFLALLIELIFSSYLVKYDNFITAKQSWFYIYKRVIKSKQELSEKVLYIGDSVGQQLMPFEKENASLTANGSVTMVGHYILVNNVISNSKNIEKVILISSPHIIGQQLEHERTMNSFIKPFLFFENKKQFSKTVYDKLKKKPVSFSYFLTGIKFFPVKDIDFSKLESNKKAYALSDISLEYILKLDSLCNYNDIILKLYSPPILEDLKENSNDWKTMKEQVEQHNLNHLFDPYFQSITYLPDTCFVDNLHLTKSWLESNRDIIKLEIAN